MQPQEFCADLQLESLEGAAIDAYAQDEGYWHLFVALRLVGGQSVVFTTEEHSAGHWFEVFPIRLHTDERVERQWRDLPTPLLIDRAIPLWRSEWIEPGAVGETLGSNPATHYAGRGPAPPKATAVARVQAGVLLQCHSGDQVVVAASNSAPFNVEMFLFNEAISTALAEFHPVP
jgi:hypothetical protein